MTDREIREFNGKPVLIVTHRGIPVSLGKIRVSELLKGAAGPRVELVFETPALACSLGVPFDRLEALRDSWNGEHYRHCLPEADGVWLAEPPSEISTEKPKAAGPAVVETYPLPERSRLVRPNADGQSKNPFEA